MHNAVYPCTRASVEPRLAHEVCAIFLTDNVSRTMHGAKVKWSGSRGRGVEVVFRVENVPVIEGMGLSWGLVDE